MKIAPNSRRVISLSYGFGCFSSPNGYRCPTLSRCGPAMAASTRPPAQAPGDHRRRAKRCEAKLKEGNILISVHSDNSDDPLSARFDALHNCTDFSGQCTRIVGSLTLAEKNVEDVRLPRVTVGYRGLPFGYRRVTADRRLKAISLVVLTLKAGSIAVP